MLDAHFMHAFYDSLPARRARIMHEKDVAVN